MVLSTPTARSARVEQTSVQVIDRTTSKIPHAVRSIFVGFGVLFGLFVAAKLGVLGATLASVVVLSNPVGWAAVGVGVGLMVLGFAAFVLIKRHQLSKTCDEGEQYQSNRGDLTRDANAKNIIVRTMNEAQSSGWMYRDIAVRAGNIEDSLQPNLVSLPAS